jgi:hypothetical protein
LFGAVALGALLVLTGAGFLHNHSSKRIPMSGERELKVNLQAGFGNIYIMKGASDQILDADVELDDNTSVDKCFEYRVHDHIGYLDLSTDCNLDEEDNDNGHHHHGIHVEGLDSRTWNMHFTDAIPISFDVELGVGKGEIDLTGMAVKDFTLSSGASSVTVRCDKLNKETIEDLHIEAGVSKFHGIGLCNTHFRHLKFEGGVGTYTLDFGGDLNKEVDVDLEVGLGSLTIIIPDHIGAKIIYEKNWITHFSLASDFSRSDNDDDVYYSSNYTTAKGKLNIHIDASLGSVRIKRGDNSE